MLLNQGLELLLYGMGTVVLFLGLLVFATRAMSATVLRFFPEPETTPAAHAIAAVSRTSPSNTAPSHQSGELAADESLRLAAVAAAVRTHRRRRTC